MNRLISMVALAVCASAGWAEMESATPESQGVDSAAILAFLDAAEQKFDAGLSHAKTDGGAFHGLVIVRHGKVIAEGSWKPFDTLNETHMLYSHSKTFTSSAIGLLADEGKVDLDERIVEIFSNDVPAQVSENLRELRIRDLLTMNAGKKDHLLRDGGNWVRDFLSQDFCRRPGTGFKYDSDATYMLAAIVEKKSGERMMDYLQRKFFDPLDITSAWTTYSPQGIPCGGWGMNMTTRDLAKFGLLYLQHGRWNGRYVLSPHWCQLATARHTWSGWRDVGVKALGEGTDWEQGYGFQLWRCRHGAYRADGADGQYTVVMPEQDMVVSIHAGLGDMQGELNLIWDYLLPAVQDKPLPETAATETLSRRLANLALPPRSDCPAATATDRQVGVRLPLRKNARGFTALQLDPCAAGWELTLVTPAGVQRLPVGRGAWARGTMRIDTETYEGLGAYIGAFTTAASGGLDEAGNLRIRVYLTGTTGSFDFTIDPAGTVKGRFRAMHGCELKSEGVAE